MLVLEEVSLAACWRPGGLELTMCRTAKPPLQMFPGLSLSKAKSGEFGSRRHQEAALNSESGWPPEKWGQVQGR